ncbi:GumC family protein [Pacificoceanicola onchidii]|uniref:GumC family protein n=1 Tax=Pacificoceanicola onchidii TaxID=2562685 RepID=UPI0010A5A717|nr:Wzz/FepE/Etk N-terminal domain-containing protein [Pacificoceanicola onchidii]
MDFGYYFRIFLRRLPWVILFVAIGSGVGFYFASTLPPVYKAEARLLVESEQIPDELAASTVQTAATEQIQIIQQRILTREVLLEMANRLDIYDDARIPASDKVADLRERIGIAVQGGRNQATLVNVSFKADKGQQAATVTNEIVTLILKENVAMRTTVSGQTLDFFTQEVDRLGQEMSRLSARMLAFQEENLDSLPDSLDFRRSRQASVQERLAALDRNENALKDRRNRLVELFEDTGTVPDAEAGQQLTVEARQLIALKRDYSSSVAILSLDNPKIAVLRARIAALEEVVAEQESQAQASDGASSEVGLPPSPFELQLADIDAQIAAIERQRVELEAQMEDLVETISETPGNTVTLDAMKRDYTNLQTQYNQAVANKARAETGDMIEALSKGQRISLVEQAIAPQNPVSPNRPLLLAGGFGGGLFVALGLIALLELLNSAIRRPSEIGDKLGIAALATVPYIETRAQIRRRRIVRASAFAAVLLVGVGGAWVLLGPGGALGGDLIQRILSQLNSLTSAVSS